MRVVLQRVSSASVSVDGVEVGGIGQGLCLLVGVARDDGPDDVDAMVHKIAGLRIFRDAAGKMNNSVLDVAGEVLVVSQFTLLGDVRRGRRPSFTRAGSPELAEPLIQRMASGFRACGLTTAEGVFGGRMMVEMVNDGPVTLVLDSHGGVLG